MSTLKKELNFKDLVLFNLVAIVGIRWISVSAASGYSALTLWTLAFLCFLVPQVLAVKVLTKKYPIDGGIYKWAEQNFGPFHGFICGWCYWGQNLTYLPSLLSFNAIIFLYCFGNKFLHLENSITYVALMSIVPLWLAVYFNVRGVRTGKWLSNIGGVGTWLTVGVLIFLGLWVAFRYGVANPFTFSSLAPSGMNLETLGVFSALCFAFAGFELAPSMAEEVKDLSMLMRSIIVSSVILTVLYILGSFSILIALPIEKVSLISGAIQAVKSLTGALELGGFVVIISAFFISLSGFGAVGAWLAGVARVPYAMGLDQYLPKSMGAVHPKYGTPHISIISQGVFATLFILIGVMGTVVKDAYLFLVNSTIIVYFIPYLYMFGAYSKVSQGLKHKLWAWLGFFTTLGSIILACLPPQSERPLLYEMKLIGSTLIFLAIGLIFYFRGKRK